jgi:hypothetical protein
MAEADNLHLKNLRQEAEIRLAGQRLRQMRTEAKNRPPRRYTGYLTPRRRAWFGQPVLLPGNVLGRILAVRHGLAAVSWTDPFAIRANRVGCVEVSSVRPFLDPCASALGRLKRGTKEKASALKREAARRNGCRPARHGRPRGRPRKVGVPSPSADKPKEPPRG